MTINLLEAAPNKNNDILLIQFSKILIREITICNASDGLENRCDVRVRFFLSILLS